MKQLLLALALVLCCTAGQAKQKIKVACVGNSVTYGYLIKDREHNAYPAQLQQMLGDAYEVRNFGRNSATLLRRGHFPYVQQPEYRQALQFAADIVVIHLGLNDTDPRNWPNYRDDFETDYYALIDSFRVANPKARIWVCLLTPIFDRHPRFLSGTRDWHEQIEHILPRIAAASGAGLIDLHRPLYNRPEFFPDALHPNAEGARILAQTVYGAITGDYGGLSLPITMTNNMVLQRHKPIVVRGRANAGTKVTVELTRSAGKPDWADATADANGFWRAELPARVAGGPYTMTIRAGKEQRVLSNVAIGEVWLCSGQSNMEFKVNQSVTAREDIAAAKNQTNVRLFDMKDRWLTNDKSWDTTALDSVNRLLYYRQDGWQPCTAQTVGNFSAVAYAFGCMLADSLGVPVGLISNPTGGSPAEAWISRHTLEWQYPEILTNWLQNDHIQPWVRERAQLNIKHAKNRLQRHPYEPCYLYEAGIMPLDTTQIAGVIWYQGESNAHNMEVHEQLFRLLVDDWRRTWQNPQLPFYFVQLSSLNRPSWPWFRDSQRRLAQEMPYVGMAVSSDLGDSLDVHPRQKRQVGQRLARLALHNTYGYRNLTPQGPLPHYLASRGNHLVLTLDYAHGLRTADGKPLRTVEIAGLDGIFYPAETRLSDGELEAWSPKVSEPTSLRYGWQPFTRANLVNDDDLPASTFRFDLKTAAY